MALKLICEQQADQDRAAIAAELRHLLERSGLDQGTFARRIGTSRTRLNIYLTGRYPAIGGGDGPGSPRGRRIGGPRFPAWWRQLG